MAEPLSWTVHRAREAPTKTAVVLVFILAFVGFSWAVFGPMLGILAVVVLFLALNTYFLPVTYKLNDKGIEVDKRMFATRYEWNQFRRWFRTSGGIVISPFSRKNFLDNFRGVHLMLPPDPQPVIAYLERRFAPPPPDDRLTLDEPGALSDRDRLGQVRVRDAEGRMQNEGGDKKRSTDLCDRLADCCVQGRSLELAA